MEFEKLTSAGQIKEGMKLKMLFNGEWIDRTAKVVLNPGTDHEEIIINKKKNYYFITSMAIDGSSWAKEVQFQPAA